MSPAEAAPSLADELADLGVSTIHEALGQTGLLDHEIRPLAAGMGLAGRAVTVELPPGDNLGIHQAIEACGHGDVLVVAATGPPFGVFGELLAVSLEARGAVGIVIDGGCRDVSELRSGRLGVFARTITARGTTKDRPVAVNESIRCGDAVVNPGDVIVGDDDGVVVVPARRIVEVIEAGRLRVELEEAGRVELERGVLTLDLLDLRSRINNAD